MFNSSFSGNNSVPTFTVIRSIAVVVGVVIGTGIFRLPPIVAGNSGSELQFILFWVAGGFIILLGALCYAELSSSKPDAGGEYHFLRQAFGPALGFIFSWGRMTVIQTGSIALAAFILGDYATGLLSLGPNSPAIYAAFTIILLTGLNYIGTKQSGKTQVIFTSSLILVMVFISVSGLLTGDLNVMESSFTGGNESLFSGGTAGLAMIYVLLTFGGWNEAAYLSGELINVRRNMIKVLLSGIAIITLLYVLVNVAYVQILGLEALQQSQTVGADFTEQIFGPAGSVIISIIIIGAALSTANATIITGARTNYALGRDFKIFGFMGRWNTKRNTPGNALLVQGIISMLLVGIGMYSQEAVSAMVDYTAPVFWFFMFLTTATLFKFRYKNPSNKLYYKVPLYPVTPILFLLVCVYMFYSSLTFTGIGALIGSAFLIAGIPVYFFGFRR